MRGDGDDDGLEAGTALSHFRILGKLGEGGMGVVYRARDTALDRDVALKLLPAGEVADAAARAALIVEARNASRLNHPNICTIHEVGEADGHVFIAMELVEGEQLRAAIPARGLPDETVVRYAAPLARALAHAHARGVLHRDIKTANIVVGPDGQAKLLDFGLSRRILDERPGGGAAAGVSSAGVVAGTPQYLAPEILEGARASVASDVWALGAVIHEMCAGQVPFAGAHVGAVVTAILHAPPAPVPAHVSAGLRTVIARCLSKDPQQRYRTADELAAALEALQPGAAAAPARRRRSLRPAPVVAVAIVVAVILLALDTGGLRTRLLGGVPRGAIGSIAVLPLEPRPPDPDQEYFADGMTEQLIADLAQVEGLRVISRTSVQRFRGTKQNLGEIAFALGVDAVVEGSVQQDGSVVRIRARLVDARTERQLWAGSFDRPLRNVLALQSDVAREVTEQIRARLTAAERTRLASSAEVNPVAFEHYLRGRYALTHMNPGGAIAEFRRAVAVDPGSVRAFAGLAHALVRSQFAGDSTVEAVRDPALAAARRAVELDAASAEGWLALANVQATLEWNLPGAEVSARRALEFGPGVAEAHHTHGLVAFVQGREEEALAELRRARELDPLNPYYHTQLAEALIFARRHDEAIAELGKLLALFPDDRAGRRDLGRAYLEKGDAARAARELEGLDPPPAALARAWAKSGKTADARRLLAGFENGFANGRGAALDIAEIHAALGGQDRALVWLERSFARRELMYLAVPFNPAFDPLRSHPRYADLARRSPWARTPGSAATP